MLDAGDALVRRKGWARDATPDKAELARRTARAELILKFYKNVGLAAMAVGPEDLLLGLPVIAKLAREQKIALVSANLRDRTGRKPFKGSTLVTVGDWKVGLVGVTWPQRFQQDQLDAEKIKFTDPVEATKAEVAALKKRGARIIVLLAATDRAKSTEIVTKIPDIHLALVASIGWLRDPIRAENGFLLGVPAGGKHIGLLELHVLKDSLKFEDQSQQHTALDQIRRTVDSWKRMRQMAHTRTDRFADRYARRVQAMETSVKRQIDKFKESAAKGTSSSYIIHRTIALDPSTGEDEACRKMVEEVKKAHGIDDLRRGPRLMRRPAALTPKTRPPLRVRPSATPRRP